MLVNDNDVRCTIPSLPIVIEDTDGPLPPPYLKVVNGQVIQAIPGGTHPEPSTALALPTDISNYHNVDELVIEKRLEGVVDATKYALFDQPICVRTENINSSTLLIMSDPDPTVPNTVKITAEITAQVLNLSTLLNITADINMHGEIEFKVLYSKSMWSYNSNRVRCQITVMIPSNYDTEHAGISADIHNGFINMENIDNVSFKYLSFKTTQQETKLTNIRADTLSVTSNGAITCKKLRVQGSVSLKSTGSLPVTVKNSRSTSVQVLGVNTKFVLQDVESEDVEVTTKTEMISCTNILATGIMRLKSTMSRMQASNITAGSLHISSGSGNLVGNWTVRELLHVSGHLDINATIVLWDPSEKVDIVVTAKTGPVEVSLPADSFRGTFNIKASMNQASVEQMHQVGSEKWVSVLYTTKNWSTQMWSYWQNRRR